jgi:hypothetical protein
VNKDRILILCYRGVYVYQKVSIKFDIGSCRSNKLMLSIHKPRNFEMRFVLPIVAESMTVQIIHKMDLQII